MDLFEIIDIDQQCLMNCFVDEFQQRYIVFETVRKEIFTSYSILASYDVQNNLLLWADGMTFIDNRALVDNIDDIRRKIVKNTDSDKVKIKMKSITEEPIVLIEAKYLAIMIDIINRNKIGICVARSRNTNNLINLDKLKDGKYLDTNDVFEIFIIHNIKRYSNKN